MINFILTPVGHKIQSLSPNWGRSENLRFGRGMPKIGIVGEQCDAASIPTLKSEQVVVREATLLCV
jgi:hypothetical protein